MAHLVLRTQQVFYSECSKQSIVVINHKSLSILLSVGSSPSLSRRDSVFILGRRAARTLGLYFSAVGTTAPNLW